MYSKRFLEMYHVLLYYIFNLFRNDSVIDNFCYMLILPLLILLYLLSLARVKIVKIGNNSSQLNGKSMQPL